MARTTSPFPSTGPRSGATPLSGSPRRTGYCALGCVGHASAEAALAHHLQYQLDRETALWLDRRTPARLCEICGEQTTLRARLGRDTTLFVLCHKHQSTKSLEKLFHERVAREQAAAPAA